MADFNTISSSSEVALTTRSCTRGVIAAILQILGASQAYQSNKSSVFPSPQARHRELSSLEEGDHILGRRAWVPPASLRAVTTGKERGHEDESPQHHGVGWGRDRMES